MNLIIESHEGSIYLAYLERNGIKQAVCRSGKYPHKFNSIVEVKEFTKNCQIEHIELHCSGSYDEMIGNPDAKMSVVPVK